MIILSILPVLGMKMGSKQPAVRRIFDAQAWKDPAYSIYAVALLIGYAGMYNPFFYIQLFCLEKGIITGSLNFYLLPIIDTTEFFGRTVIAFRFPQAPISLTENIFLAVLLTRSGLCNHLR
jgi:hypothetical protein